MSVSLSQINQKAEVSSNDVYLVLSSQAGVPKRRLGWRQGHLEVLLCGVRERNLQ